MNSIFKKIAIRISILFFVVIVASSIVSIVYLDRSYKENIKNSLLREAQVVESMISSGVDIEHIAYNIDQIMDMRFTILDLSGKVVLDTRVDAALLDNHIDRPEIIAALKNGSGVYVRHSDTLEKDLMYTAIYSKENQLVIRTSQYLEGISEYSADLWAPLISVLVISFLLCLIISLFVSRSITRPIIQIRNDTVRIAQGQYDSIERLRTGDEIEELSDALNDMVESLKSSIADISEKNSRLQAVFKAVPGGILAVDNNEAVIMANPAAREMFSIVGVPEGKHFLEVAKNVKLELIINDAMQTKGVIQKEITITRGMDEIYLQVFAVSVMNNGIAYGVILLAQDITRIKKLESMRSDFVANVSHELKTPLTVISGFIDTLKDTSISAQNAPRFLDIISLESERLTRLIDDVLVLADIENTTNTPINMVDIRTGVEEAVQLLENRAKKKQVDMKIKLPNEPVIVAAEQDRIIQMVINLVDNAIKYTLANGNVAISLTKDASRAVLCVSDTGIGIPKENLPRLFERFYRVDKGRSRALGGTGLGLAIVKHIVNLLNGHITVQSKVGVGTKFHVYLPIGYNSTQENMDNTQ